MSAAGGGRGGAEAQPLADHWLVVLAKQPIAGHAKTRLARDIGVDRAQELALAFVTDTLSLISSQRVARVLVAFSPRAARGWFEERARGAELFPQPDESFGGRLEAATREAFRLGASRCVVIGTDSPQLEPGRLAAAFDALGESDVCLGPSHDGGYYLIGLRREEPSLFADIPWSSEGVLVATRERAAEARLSVVELPAELDVDEGADLVALESVLRERPAAGTATRAALARLADR